MNRKVFLVLLFMLFAAGIILIMGKYTIWKSAEQKPEQPIAFSHSIHTGKAGLKCIQCHLYTESSPVAGIPDMKICADCHQKVAADRPEIKKLMKYWENREPIPWNKVHRKPWHVYFTHKRHIKAGIECTSCHGNVEVMDTVRQVRSMDMGWCVTCHREKDAPTDCLTCHK